MIDLAFSILGLYSGLVLLRPRNHFKKCLRTSPRLGCQLIEAWRWSMLLFSDVWCQIGMYCIQIGCSLWDIADIRYVLWSGLFPKVVDLGNSAFRAGYGSWQSKLQAGEGVDVGSNTKVKAIVDVFPLNPVVIMGNWLDFNVVSLLLIVNLHTQVWESIRRSFPYEVIKI